VSFGQSLPESVLHDAAGACRRADLLLAIGSSLVVEPAASLPRLAKQAGGRLVIINRDETPLDHLADAVLRDSIGETLSQIAGFVRDA
jgi:NAD-dependent deacetylase